jgi:hypothetical protein
MTEEGERGVSNKVFVKLFDSLSDYFQINFAEVEKVVTFASAFGRKAALRQGEDKE